MICSHSSSFYKDLVWWTSASRWSSPKMYLKEIHYKCYSLMHVCFLYSPQHGMHGLAASCLTVPSAASWFVPIATCFVPTAKRASCPQLRAFCPPLNVLRAHRHMLRESTRVRSCSHRLCLTPVIACMRGRTYSVHCVLCVYQPGAQAPNLHAPTKMRLHVHIVRILIIRIQLSALMLLPPIQQYLLNITIN